MGEEGTRGGMEGGRRGSRVIVIVIKGRREGIGESRIRGDMRGIAEERGEGGERESRRGWKERGMRIV